MPCDPRNWSRSRLLRGFGLLAVAFAAAWAYAGTWLAGFPAAMLVVGADALCAALLRRIDPLDLKAALKEQHRGAFGSVLVGDIVTLEVSLSAPSLPFRSLLVTPVLPVGIDPADKGGAVVRPAPLTTLTFALKAVHAGTHVLPGVIVRQSSPLGLFSRSRLLAARLSLQVLPDFVSSRDPALAHLFRRAFRIERFAPRRIRGGGSDFHELREYRFADPITRVDWKATARRRDLIVREYDEPLEIRMQVLLDASLDMTHDSNERSRFHAASSLVTRLACAAVVREMSLRVTAYDEGVVLDTSIGRGTTGCMRIATQVADLSHQSVLRRATAVLAAPELYPRLFAHLDRTRRAWQPGPGPLTAEFAADTAAASLRDAGIRCPGCGERVFPEEPSCPRCDRPLGNDGLSPRASTLASLLSRDRGAHGGRGMLFLVSSLQGGEACDRIADLLAGLADRGRLVHVVAPGVQRNEIDYPAFPGSLGHAPDRSQVLAEIADVGHAVGLRRFARRLQEGRVHWHAIDDDSDLERLVSEAMMCPV